MTSHLEATLQRDIELIRGKVLEMAGLAEKALQTCLQSLVERNRQLAYAVILRDQRIDELEKQVDRLCLEFLVRQQPVAGHLRFVYATIKINAELERIGDYAESIARQILKLSSLELPISPERLAEIAGFAIPMLRDAIKAFVDQNAVLARDTMGVEEKVDALRKQIDAELVRGQQEGRMPLEDLTPLLTIVRRLERVSDQAKNICEETLYMCTGEYAKHKGTEVVRVLFVDEHNSCRSAIAEGIANSFQERGLIFSSAGLQPRPVDLRAISFLALKGIDISRHVPKSLDRVPNLEHYQVMVALADGAKQAFPKTPAKTVCLDWTVRDPSTVEGTPAEVQAAYEQTFQFLEAHIRDLVHAILGNHND